MKFFLVLWAVFLLAAAAQGRIRVKARTLPGISVDVYSEKLVLSEMNIVKDEFIKYRGEHIITNLVVAYNVELFVDDDDDNDPEPLLFFNQVDIKPDGERIQLGQFVFVNGTAQKIFNGTCSTTDIGEPKVYFGAKDGLYVYNETTNGADKLGTVNDSIIQLQITHGSNEIYILTEPDYKIYKVNIEGTQKTLVEAITSAKAFVLDRNKNIYYYGDNKVPYVLSVGSSEPVQFSSFEGIEKPILVRTANILEQPGVLFVNGKNINILQANGTKEQVLFEMKASPTSISLNAILFQYYALDNNIYEFNIIERYMKILTEEFWKRIRDALKEKVRSYILRPKPVQVLRTGSKNLFNKTATLANRFEKPEPVSTDSEPVRQNL